MQYWGVERPVVENALAIYDPESEIFGHWGRAVQRAGALGLDGWVARFRDWESVKAQVAQGRPVIASVRFRKGEFPSSVLPQTNGHLIVVRGFTPEGDVIVNDPASRDRGNGAVYKAAELARAWFDRGGVGYVIAGRAPVAGATSAAPPASRPTTARVVSSRER
jgi:Peptidase_C39 like family